MSMSFNGSIGIGKQSVFKTKVARTEFMRFIDANIEENPNAAPLENSGSQEIDAILIGPWEIKATGVVELRPDNCGLILYSLMGAVASAQIAATSAYKHTFTRADSPKHLSLEYAYGTNPESEDVTGFAPEEVVFEFTDRLLTMDFGGPAHKVEANASPTSKSLVTTSPFTKFMAAITLGGVAATVRSMRLTVNRNPQMDDFVNGSLFLDSLEYGAFLVTADWEVVFDDLTERKKFWGGTGAGTTPDSLVKSYADSVVFTGEQIGATGEYYIIQFNLPKNIIVEHDAPMHGKDQIIQRFKTQAIYDGSSKTMDIELTNEETAY